MPYNPFMDDSPEAETLDPFGRTETELARLDQEDFELKLEREDQINGQG